MNINNKELYPQKYLLKFFIYFLSTVSHISTPNDIPKPDSLPPIEPDKA